MTVQGPKATRRQHRGSCHLFDPTWAPAQTQDLSSQGPSQRTAARSGLSLCSLPRHLQVTSMGSLSGPGAECGAPLLPHDPQRSGRRSDHRVLASEPFVQTIFSVTPTCRTGASRAKLRTWTCPRDLSLRRSEGSQRWGNDGKAPALTPRAASGFSAAAERASAWHVTPDGDTDVPGCLFSPGLGRAVP